MIFLNHRHYIRRIRDMMRWKGEERTWPYKTKSGKFVFLHVVKDAAPLYYMADK